MPVARARPSRARSRNWHLGWGSVVADIQPDRHGSAANYLFADGRVESIAEASKGLKVLIEPFDAGIAVVGFFQTPDGGIVEFMEYPEGE